MPRLSEVARHVVQPAGIVATGWPAVRDTCARVGLSFDEWQDGGGRLILAKRADGLYAADTIVLSIPRQVGKTFLIGAIIFALCIVCPGMTVIWTAHRFKTARETFDDLKALALIPGMSPHVDPNDIHSGAGNESIHFRNGSRILFGARERGFGRGFTLVDVLVYDEGQILTQNAVTDMVPATNHAPNPLIFMIGTPPGPDDPGEVFREHRAQALSGESDDTLYIEFSADEGTDPMDRVQWAKANPSFPHRTSERAMLRMIKHLKGAFPREGLGIWDRQAVKPAVVQAEDWDGLVDGGPALDVAPGALAVDMSPGLEVSVAACWLDADLGDPHVEEVWAGVDDGACVDWLVERAGRRIPVVVDAASPARSLIPKLRARRVRVLVTSAVDMASACGMWLGDVTACRLTHGGQAVVGDALAGAGKRAIGKAGGWGWDRTDLSVNIAPLVAHTLARYGASLKERPAGRGRSSEGRRAVVL